MQRPLHQRDFFKKDLEKIEILPYSEKPLKKESKLFLLFQSENMTLDLLMYYLSKRFHQQGVRNFLINKLYLLKDDDLTFYIPELW